VLPPWDYGDEDKPNHIRTWEMDGFKLEMYDTGRRDSRGTTNIAFRLTDGGEVIFQDEDFHPSPMHCDDSDETVAGLLAFLSLKEGDTDSEYFQKYTPRQLEWSGERAEELSMLQMTLEEMAEAEEFRTSDGYTLTKGEDDDGNTVWTDGDHTFKANAVGHPVRDNGDWLEGEPFRNGRPMR
jgi:hypothetical protein